MRRALAILCLIALASFARAAVDPEPIKTVPPATTMPVEPSLFRAGEGPGPTFDANVVHLLSGAEREENGLVLPASCEAPPSSFEVRATVRMDAGGEGFGVLLLDAAAPPAAADALSPEAWEEPNRANAVGIGFDGRNVPVGATAARATPPLPSDAADAEGNLYDRPQREASLHVDGREVYNRQAADFATGAPVPIVIGVRFVPGGAMIDVRVGDRAVYEETLLAGVRPFAPRVAIGARAGLAPRGARLDVRDVAVTCGPTLKEPFTAARHVTLYDRVPVSLESSREPAATVDFGDVGRGAARVIATLRIDAPAGGMDRLDRRGALYCIAADGQRYEVFRFRTPAGRPWQWAIDVTDFLPLFRGDGVRFGLFIDTWQRGYVASVALDFYPGPIERVPVAVVNLWQGEPILGEPSEPVASFFAPRTVIVPPGATGAKVRITVTGHGQSPNTGNAAEFLRIGRTLWANGTAFTNVLWKTDNYLNPCRPQSGTWRTDRAGWGPGSITEPWTIDVSSLLGEGVDRTLRLEYVLDEYVNEHIGRGDPPTHWVDGQVIFYAKE